jgi:hypothetical protein
MKIQEGSSKLTASIPFDFMLSKYLHKIYSKAMFMNISRMEAERTVKRIYEWQPHARRKRGRP